MKLRHWYGLDRSVNPVGFGCWQLAGRYWVDGNPQGWVDIDASDAVALVHLALDRGVRFFDTAVGYGEGRSEFLLGQALATSGLGDEAIICTKIAVTPEEQVSGRVGQGVAAQVEASLRRLRRDRIDILLLHGPPDETDWQAFDRRPFEDLQASGKILTYGVSSRSLAGAQRVLEVGFGSCIQWAFNLLERRPVSALFPKLASKRMNFVARSPLSRGILAKKYAGGVAAFSPNDFRSTLPKEWVEWASAAAERLAPITCRTANPAEYALRYCLSYPEVSAVIPGMHKASQVEDLISAAAAGPLDPAVLASVEGLVEPCYPPWAKKEAGA